MNERIKALRKSLGLTQVAFAQRIGVKQNTVATYETGRTTPGDTVIALIVREFGVYEPWLRSGEGQMFAVKDRETEISEFVGEILSGDTPEFRKRLVSVLARLDDNGWDVLERIVDSLTKKD